MPTNNIHDDKWVKFINQKSGNNEWIKIQEPTLYRLQEIHFTGKD